MSDCSRYGFYNGCASVHIFGVTYTVYNGALVPFIIAAYGPRRLVFFDTIWITDIKTNTFMEKYVIELSYNEAVSLVYATKRMASKLGGG